MKDSQDKNSHRKIAIQLFNSTWDLMDKGNHTETGEMTMNHSSHTSRFGKL